MLTPLSALLPTATAGVPLVRDVVLDGAGAALLEFGFPVLAVDSWQWREHMREQGQAPNARAARRYEHAKTRRQRTRKHEGGQPHESAGTGTRKGDEGKSESEGDIYI